MKKAFHISIGIFALITTIAFVYLFCTMSGNTSLGQLCTYMVLSAVSILMFIMTEPRPRNTEFQRRHDDRVMNQGLLSIFLIACAVAMVVLMNSCAPTGYGCNGRSKCMTRVR